MSCEYLLFILRVDVQQFASGAGYTVMPYDPLYLKVIGQRVEWSFLDAKAVNFYYCNSLYCAAQCFAPVYQYNNQ